MPKDKDESIFDVSRLRELIELMQEHELNEVDLRQAEQRIRLRRGPDGLPTIAAMPAVAPATAAAAGSSPSHQPSSKSEIMSVTIRSSA